MYSERKVLRESDEEPVLELGRLALRQVIRCCRKTLRGVRPPNHLESAGESAAW
jgi:hypothetical protein